MRLQHSAAKDGKKIVLIIGGGFAGLRAAKVLARQKEVQVILIDRKNHHLFQPLLYQVATAGLDPSDIAVPIRAQFTRDPNIEVHLGAVEAVDLAQKTVRAGKWDIAYDYLILACGAQHSYFGHEEWEPYAPGLKLVEQATEIRRRILFAFEQAENEFDPERQRELLTFVIVGGGATGVELAGAIADISRTVLTRDFRRIIPAQARVILVEAMDRILSSFSPELSQRALRDLNELGVEVLLNDPVQKIDETGVQLRSHFIAARSVFWGAGVQASRLHIIPAPDLEKNGRVKVAPDFSVALHPEVFVTGDMASYVIAPGKQLPGQAPAAMQAGAYVARCVLADLRQKPRPVFHYRDKGQMATIGKHRAIVEFGRFKMSGYLAWVAWFFVHIFYLVGFKNRVTVFLQWCWSYLFSRRGSRLITDRDWRLQPEA